MRTESDELTTLSYLYLMLCDGLEKKSHDIKCDAEIPQALWAKLRDLQIIECYGSSAHPIYKWVAKEPDEKMALELSKDYPMFMDYELFEKSYEKKDKYLTRMDFIKNHLDLCKMVFETRPYSNHQRGSLIYFARKEMGYSNNTIDLDIMSSLSNGYKYIINEINQLKPNEMLHEKDLMFNWVVPSIGSQGRNIQEDFRVNYKHNTVYIGWSFLDKNYPGIDRNNVHVAFMLNEKEKSYVVFEPPVGVPFFKFNASIKGNSKHKSPAIGNKELVLLLKKALRPEEGNNICDYKLQAFQRLSNLMFYEIMPV